MTNVTDGTGVRRAVIRRVEPADAARMRALRLEMLADAPLAFLETIAEAAARPHAEYAARRTRRSSWRIRVAGWSGTPVGWRTRPSPG